MNVGTSHFNSFNRNGFGYIVNICLHLEVGKYIYFNMFTLLCICNMKIYSVEIDYITMYLDF